MKTEYRVTWDHSNHGAREGVEVASLRIARATKAGIVRRWRFARRVQIEMRQIGAWKRLAKGER